MTSMAGEGRRERTWGLQLVEVTKSGGGRSQRDAGSGTADTCLALVETPADRRLKVVSMVCVTWAVERGVSKHLRV